MPKKYYKRVKNRIKTFPIKACLAGRFDADSALILTSSPRSGSTVLGQMLATIPDSCLLFEPLHLIKVPEAASSHFSWHSYVDPDAEWIEGEAFLRRVFEGRVINKWTSREMSFRDAYKSKQLIVKSVRANRLLPWICRRFKVPSPVLLLRHPCAVIASQLRVGWMKNERPQSPRYIEQYPMFKSALLKTEVHEEHLAALWALDQLAPLLQQPPYPWMIVTYEELVLRPQSTLEKIFKRWNQQVDINAAASKLKTPSSVVREGVISGINGWKKQLTDEQVSRILNTVNAFGLNFYTEEFEADYDLLNSERLAEHIQSAGIS